jgi:SAM-dependent methyltransferase
MQKIDINALPQWSPWPARLLGISKWNMSDRNIDKVDEEYDKDKYAKCLAFYNNADKKVGPWEVKLFEAGNNISATICVSQKDDLVTMSLERAISKYYRLLVETMRREIECSQTVIELGCGYGYNLWLFKQYFPEKNFIGGEYSQNAVQLASVLYKDDPNINVRYFNYYDSIYEILEGIREPIIILTIHSIEQLPNSTAFIEALYRYRNSIKNVFHFEPAYGCQMLGLMRQRYAEVNDYNRDLISQLQQRSDKIRIIHKEFDVFGLNPLNPTSVIHWEFIE